MKRALLLLLLVAPPSWGAAFDVFTSTKFGTYVAGCTGYFETLSTWTAQVAISTTNNLNTCRTNTDVWAQVEPTEEVFNWSTFDAEVLISTAAGQDFIFTLPIFNSNWSTVNSTCTRTAGTHCPHTIPLQYYQFVKRAAQRYKGVIHYWEVWNEPDYPGTQGGWFGEANPDPTEYLPLLKMAYIAIKEVDPTNTVLLGGLSYLTNFNRSTYFDKLLANGGGAYFDKANFHLYADAVDPSWGDAITTTQQTLAKYNLSKPIWVTETSNTGALFQPGFTETNKAEWLVKSFSILLSTSGVDRVIWHTLRNCGTDAGLARNFDFGLSSVTLQDLPAMTAWKGFQSRLLGYTPQTPSLTATFNEYVFTKSGGSDRFVLWPVAASASGASAGGYSSIGVRDMFNTFISSYTAAAFPSQVFYSTGPVYLEGIP